MWRVLFYYRKGERMKDLRSIAARTAAASAALLLVVTGGVCAQARITSDQAPSHAQE